ncbi:conserved hypothetical protein [Ricinus communis]|uniref:FLZ-type domain-containing protein n=1 Tax=Ricinus communis TaxID=3988 RepID=B9SFI1_RICCO|nr:conserved hypothetical protein [Ricinus communis]
MANKRSRPGRSQSFTDIALFDAPPPQPFSELPPDPSALLSNNRLLHNQPRQIVFSALSYSAPLDPRRPNVDFLEICSTCKKWVDHTKDIYMYKLVNVRVTIIFLLILIVEGGLVEEHFDESMEVHS